MRTAMEVRPAIGRLEFAIFPQARRAWMIEAGTRPEDAHVVLDLLVGDAVVVGGAALRRDAQLVENFLAEVLKAKCFAAPRRRASSMMISVSVRASPGGVTACRMRVTRPSAVVTVPSSSSCSDPASTISAW